MSTTSAKTVNYIDLFTYKELEKCNGEPTYEKIKRIENQCKTNATRFNTTLGGGQHKYLGLVLSPARYQLLSGVPFQKPNHPPPLDIPQGTTAAVATAMKEQHVEAKRLYEECDGIENAMKQQLLNAFELDYLTDLIDRNTQSLTHSIPEIFEHLYKSYGTISLAEFYEKQQQLEDAPLDLQVPLTVLWNKIEDLQELAEHIQSPISDTQCINMAMRKLIQAKVFTEDLKKWNHLQDKSWPIFKTHFRKAQQDLKDLGGLQVNQSIYSANIVNEVIEGVNQLLDTRINQEPSPPPVPEPTANVVQPSSTAHGMDPNLMAQFQMFMQMQNMMRGGRGRGRGFRGGRGRGSYGRRQMLSYCWTHGACNHNGFQCLYPAEGHVPQATLQNRMNGSNKHCNSQNIQPPQSAQPAPNQST
jgi:HPt (histidine-containing phosphotransfer) domain-containing protein